jgi:NAD(P)-dependent dehydrogenase (short-subunit alcohol dehydrogenase family)
MMQLDSLFSLEGEVAVITGGGRGIGEGIADLFAEAGAAVVVAARRTEEVEAVSAKIRERGGRAIGVTADVTDDAAIEALAHAAVDEFGSLSIWINNAGGSPARCSLGELTRDEWNAAVALNLSAVWIGCTTAARFIETGSIINISSKAATGAVPGSGHYAACKAGVDSLTRTLSVELAPEIRVNGVAPGAVPTEIMMTALNLTEEDLPTLVENSSVPMQRLGTPLDIAGAALYLAAPSGAWVTGQTLLVTGGR